MNKAILNNKKLLILYLSVILIVCLVFLACFNFVNFSLLIQKAHAATEGPQPPTITGNDTSAGTVSWSSIGNITASDNQRAEAVLDKSITSNYLTATGFDFSAIPDGATILGITAEIERSEAGNTTKSGIVDSEVRIIQDGIINNAQNKADTVALWPDAGSESYAVYGGASDLWGASWTISQIKSANFGVAVSAKNFKITGGGAETAQIDNIRITVAYGANPLTDQIHFRWRNDDGDEATATWKAIEDSNNIGDMQKNITTRLRIKSQNIGIGTEFSARAYELQWGEKITSCTDINTWIGVGDVVDEWGMAPSQLVEGQLITTERLTPASSFNNGEEKETIDTTGVIWPLDVGAGTEIEYSISASSVANGGTTYCFRLYDTISGAPIDSYNIYPEATIASEFSLEQMGYRWRNDDGGESTGQRLIGIIRPDGDSSVAWGIVVPLGSHYTAVDDAVIQPTVGDTGDYISDNAKNIDDFNMETLTGSGLYNRIDVWVYSRTLGNERLNINLIIAGVHQNAQRHTLSNSFGWYQTSFSGLALNQEDLDNLVVSLEQVKIGTQSNVDIAAIYAEVYEDTLAATFKTGKNTIIIDQQKSKNVRLRFLIKNNGADSTGPQDYNLQFASMSGADCYGGDEKFTDVPAQGGCGALDVCMADSIYFANQDYSLNILPGITDPAGVFAVGKLVENTSNQATAISLNNNEFTELEYNFEFTVNAIDGGNYCFRVSMAETDLNNYSQVAKITLTGGGYPITGTYISSAFNTGAPSVFNVIEWSESKTNPLCALCNIKLQIKTAPDSGGLPGAWSATWCGSEGEDGDETDYFIVSSGELIHTDHNWDQWIQYRVTLESDGVDTPILEKIGINYK